MALALAGCTTDQLVQVQVDNPTGLDRKDEMVEIPAENLVQLKVGKGKQLAVLSEDGTAVPCQMTYDDRLIFPASVGPNASATYTITVTDITTYDTVSCGRVYPERLDDLAWENDKAAYRAYGPALQQKGERAFGYDVFTKSVSYPVVEERYRMETDAEAWAKIGALRKEGNHAAADSLTRAISYHVDHGNGMDVYSVGPTLGGGTAALMVDSTIVYPYCYKECEILDNGPLRFTARLVFNPLTVDGDTDVVETRIISLDMGSHLNRTLVRYDGLTKPQAVASGLVIHQQNPDGGYIDEQVRYITYADSTDNASADNGVIHVGAVFKDATEMCVRPFSAEERAQRGGALGHVLAISPYNPGDTFEYYWGSGWSKGGMETNEDWKACLEDFIYRQDHPLQTTIIFK